MSELMPWVPPEQYKATSVENLHRRRALLASRLAEMSIVPCDVETGEVLAEHPELPGLTNIIPFPLERTRPPEGYEDIVA